MGYDAMSLTINRPEELEAARVGRIMKEYGLKVSGLATGRCYTVDGLGLAMADPERRNGAVDRMLAHKGARPLCYEENGAVAGFDADVFRELCARLGEAKLIIGAVRGRIQDAGGAEEYTKLFRDSLERILKRAEPLGVQLALEAISKIDSDAYCLVGETAEFIRSFHTPALRLQLDSIHLHTNGETDFASEIVKAGDLVGQVDISDLNRMLPDGKHFDFPRLMEALKKIDYQDYLVFEYRAAPPENAAGLGLQYIRSLM